ncbi:MAG: hypothetical protein GX774_03015 [Armatimonadetes bacterium]|nr:hypothetical protein [Armatimonadota bacterium]
MTPRESVRLLLALTMLLGGSMGESAIAALTAEVRQTPAGPKLFLNGQATPPTVLFVNLYDAADPVRTPVQLGEVAAAGRQGVHLVSLTIGTPWPRAGETPDYTRLVDHTVEAALQANPKALLIPRIALTYPPDWWYQEHPDERMWYDDGKPGIPSIHSAVWRRDAARHLGELVAHLEVKYSDHILGYHPSGQTSGEWFYDRVLEGCLASLEPPARDSFRRFLKAKYRTDAALRRAWRDPTVTLATAEPPAVEKRRQARRGAFRDPAAERPVIDFDEFRNHDMADAVLHLCRTVKQVAPRKLCVTFFGYPFELAPVRPGLQATGHLALRRVLQSPYVDVLCSPVSYLDRGIGGGGYFMAPVDSVLQHGKLWLVEDDTRTHLSPPDSGYGRTSDFRGTRGVLARNFGHVLSRGTAIWWMDLPGEGWFAGDEIWEYLSRLHQAYATSLADRTPYRPEIAVIYDERSPLYGAPNPQVTAPLLYRFRAQWYRIGAPTGIYLLDDLVAGKVPPAKLYIFLNAFRLEESQLRAIRRHTGRPGRVALWIYAPGYVRGDTLSPEHLRAVTGIAVREVTPCPGRIVTVDGETFAGDYEALSPTFAVDDAAVTVVARYAEGGAVAVAAKRVGESTSVYSGVLQLPAALLREFARRAGVHLYNEQNNVVMAGSGWVALHASTTGTHTLRLPCAAAVQDAVTGEVLGPAQSYPFALQQGDTKLLRVLPARR